MYRLLFHITFLSQSSELCLEAIHMNYENDHVHFLHDLPAGYLPHG